LNTAVEELIANLTTISSSRYLKRLRDEVEGLLRDVWLAQETINVWLNVQKNWIYLENIFASPEIKSRLKE
jgi:dynein heavy chain, axonemal